MNASSPDITAWDCVRQLGLRFYGAVPAVEPLSAHNHFVFRLRFSSSSKVLKLAKSKTSRSIRNELSVIRFLQARRFPVPRIEQADDGARIVGRPFILMEDSGSETAAHWINEKGAFVQRIFAEMGSLLATIHAIADAEMAELLALEPIDMSARAQSLYADGERFADDGLLDKRDVERFKSLPLPNAIGTQLCHGDFHSVQCIVREGRIVAVTDWESAWIGDAGIDLAVSHAYLDYYGREDLRAEFFRGYSSVLAVPDDNERMSYAVRMAHMIQLLRARNERATNARKTKPVADRAAELFRAYARSVS